MIFLELALLVWTVAVGFIVASTFWPYDRVGLAIVSPIVGAALYVLSGLLLLGVGLFSTTASLAMASIVAIGAVSAATIRQTLRSGLFLLTSAGYLTLGTLAVFAVAGLGAFARLTSDSFVYLTIAGGLERFGEIPDFSTIEILKRQFVVPAFHTFGVVTGRGYFLPLTTLVVLSGFCLMLWIGAVSLRRQSVSTTRIALALSLVGIFILSTNRVLYSFFYINSHGMFAAFLIALVGLVWYATLTEEWSAMPIAALAAAVIVPLRAEGIIVVAFFLLPVLVSSLTPSRVRWILVLPLAATSVVWNGVVLPRTLPEGSITISSSPAVALGIAVALVLLVALTHISVLHRFIRWVPVAGFVALVLYTAARSTRGTTKLFDTLRAMGANIAVEGYWSSFWWIAPLILVACVAATRIRHRQILLWGLAAYPVLLLTFIFLRGSAYREGPGDSGNRMLVHIVFVVGLFLIVSLGQLAAQVDDDQWSMRGFYRGLVDSFVPK